MAVKELFCRQQHLEGKTMALRRVVCLAFIMASFPVLVEGQEPQKVVAQMSKDITECEGENKVLKKQLLEYKSLEEDLMARRVFDKARKLITTYLSIGGLVIVLGGIIGIKSVIDYAKSLAREKIKLVSQEEVEAAMDREAKQQITALLKEREVELIQFTRQQIELIVSASQPIALPREETLPAATAAQIDYTNKLGLVRHQGNEGSSVGFAVAAALEYHVNKAQQVSSSLSPRHIYYYARLKGGLSTDQDTGSHIRDAVSVLLERGAVPEEAWVYRPGEFASKPPANLENMIHYKIKHASTVDNVEQLKAALFSNGPVVGGFIIFNSLFDEHKEIRKTGIIKMPAATETQIGAHGVCFVGYNDETRLFKFRNSWGVEWGDKGYGYLPYDYVDRFLRDAWTISM